MSGFETTTVLNTKIGEVEHKTLDVSSLVEKTDYKNFKYKTSRENVSLLLIVINLLLTYLM